MDADEVARVTQELRAQISDNDRAIVRALNRRLDLVARLKRHKDTHGIAFVDPQQEEAILRDLSRANRGPLSQEGLRDLYLRILELTKREVLRSEEARVSSER
jgi:chorismate mutase